MSIGTTIGKLLVSRTRKRPNDGLLGASAPSRTPPEKGLRVSPFFLMQTTSTGLVYINPFLELLCLSRLCMKYPSSNGL